MISAVAEMLNTAANPSILSRTNRFSITQLLLQRATMSSISTTLTHTTQTLMAFSSLCLTRVTQRLQFLICQCQNRATSSPIILEVHNNSCRLRNSFPISSRCFRCPYLIKIWSILRLISRINKAEELISCRLPRHRPSKVSNSLLTKTSILQCHWCWTICLWPRLNNNLSTAPHPRQEAQITHLKEESATTTLKTRISMLILAAAMVALKLPMDTLSFSVISLRGSALFKKASN